MRREAVIMTFPVSARGLLIEGGREVEGLGEKGRAGDAAVQRVRTSPLIIYFRLSMEHEILPASHTEWSEMGLRTLR
jgi:hypothetical protein